jgi:uncharacterized protein YijF (DUF1287 family)
MVFPAANRPSRRRSLAALLLFASAAVLSPQTNKAQQISEQEFLKKLTVAAVERTTYIVRYDPAYVRIPYPGGDVPAGTGVCTDEIILSIAPWASTCKKKSTRTWNTTFPPIRMPAAGGFGTPIPTSTTAVFRTS